MGSAKRKIVKLRRGDLFEFAATDGRLAYGIVVIPGGVFFAAILKTLHSERPDLSMLERDDIALLGETMDSLFFHDRWKIIAQDFPVPQNLPFQNWKVQIDGALRTTDFEGRLHWPIRPDEVDLLDYKWSRSPILFQDALEALDGIREWRDDYEKMTPAYAARRVTRT